MVTPFAVLTVCRANIARSYFAERFLLAELSATGVSDEIVAVESRGTHVDPGQEIPEDIHQLVRQLGGEPGQHIPTQLVASDLERADVVLVAEDSTHDDFLHLLPTPAPHVFTLIQFARLVSELDWDTIAPMRKASSGVHRSAVLRDYVERISRYRDYLPPDGISGDIADPAGHTHDVLTQTAETIYAHARTIARWCAG
jgi:protein-tyrosine-phosphatase